MRLRKGVCKELQYDHRLAELGKVGSWRLVRVQFRTSIHEIGDLEIIRSD